MVVTVLLVVESHLVDDVTKSMDVSIPEVWDKFVGVEVVLKKRASGGEVEVSNDLVDGNLACNIAPFSGLFMDTVRPMFGNALRV